MPQKQTAAFFVFAAFLALAAPAQAEFLYVPETQPTSSVESPQPEAALAPETTAPEETFADSSAFETGHVGFAPPIVFAEDAPKVPSAPVSKKTMVERWADEFFGWSTRLAVGKGFKADNGHGLPRHTMITRMDREEP